MIKNAPQSLDRPASHILLGSVERHTGRRMKTLVAARTLDPYLKPHRVALLGIAAAGMLASFLECVGIGLLVSLIGNAANGPTEAPGRLGRLLSPLLSIVPEQRRGFSLVCAVFLAILLKCALSYGNVLCAATLKSRIGHNLRVGMFQQLLRSGYSFIETNDWGRILESLASESWRTTQAISYLISLITSLATVSVFAALLIWISWQISLVIGGGMLLVLAVNHVISAPVKRLGQEAVRENGTLGAWMLDGVAGMRVIHSYSLQEHMQAQFEIASERVRRAFWRVDVRSGFSGPVSEVLYSALLLGIFLLAAQRTASMPSVVAAMMIFYRLQPQLRELESARVNLIALGGAVESVGWLLSPLDKHVIASGPRTFDGLGAGLEMRDVGFRYPNSPRGALHNVSFSIPTGKTTAIIGPSGAGKTTILHLVCRLYDPTEGEILVNGAPLQEFDVESWRCRIALAGQDVHLFNTTVRENIRYGRLDATDDELIAAAKRANAHDFIAMLPQGYDTEVGDRGTRMSGGQRQRISLARALLRDPEILILDEATNALDSISEAAILEAVEEFARTRTVIIVAHRLSTVRNADKIVVIDAGMVVEQGLAKALLENDGLFQKLHRLQTISLAE